VNDDDFNREYIEATEGAGLFTLEGWSTIRVTGAERAAFLHNMCTNDVRGLSPATGCEAFFTDVKGKIVAHAFILVGENDTTLILPASEPHPLLSHLDRYIIREDVQLHDESASTTWSLTGRHAGTALGQQAQAQVASLSAPWSHAPIQLGDSSAVVVRCDLSWCGAYLFGVRASEVHTVIATLRGRGASITSAPIWHAIRVESAWPMWSVDFDGSNLAQEVGRDSHAIHFRKGCYLGQETVARIDALGHVNKKLVQVRFDDGADPAVGAELSVGGQPVGRITSATWSPRRQAPVAIAMVKRGANDEGSIVQCGELSGTVTSKPMGDCNE
jgi:folate-binding protein YgfZ